MNQEKLAKELFKWSFIVFILPFSSFMILVFNKLEIINLSQKLDTFLNTLIALATTLGVMGILVGIILLAKTKPPTGGTN